ncbi:MAG: hypothetical protein ACRDRK_00935 [Pseudonocardia sp.]
MATSVGLAITLLGLAAGFTGYIWALVGGVMLGDVVGGLRAPWIEAWVLGATAVVLAAGYPISASAMADIPISPWFPTAVAVWFVGTRMEAVLRARDNGWL